MGSVELEKVVLTEKTAKVLEILKGNGGEMTGAEIAALDPESFVAKAASVTPILTNLFKKDLISKSANKVDRVVIDAKTGNEVTRQYTAYQIADAGAELVYETKSA